MAKEQNLSLNPTKISGVCGRLMCCLKNEQETYEYLNSRLPSVGDSVITPTGMHGEVSGVNVLRQLVKVVVDNGEEKELQEYAVDDLKFTPRRCRDVRVTDEEMKELEGLEDNGSTEEENERPQRENRRENNRGKYRREQNDASPRRMSEAKAVRIVRKTIAARNASIVTAVTIAAKSANTATGMTTVRNASTGNAAITVAETIIVTAARMQTVKTVAGRRKTRIPRRAEFPAASKLRQKELSGWKQRTWRTKTG